MMRTLLLVFALFALGCSESPPTSSPAIEDSIATIDELLDDGGRLVERSGDCWIWYRGDVYGPYDCDLPGDEQPAPCVRIIGLQAWPCD